MPFSGQAQRLPDENSLRANAIQRMRELGHQSAQRRRGREMVDRQTDLGRALRRGSTRGDVVGPEKHKRDLEEFAPNPRRRIGDHPPGPQMFSIATSKSFYISKWKHFSLQATPPEQASI